MQFLMHYDYMNFIIQIFIISVIYFPVYIISYYDVRKPIIVFLFFFCHYDCSLLKILPSLPELVCNYKFCSNNTKKKIRATGAQTPHSINMMHCSGCVFTVCVCVFTAVCVCTRMGQMQSTNSEYGSPYLVVCHVIFTFNKSTTLPSTVFLHVCNFCTKEALISCSKISSLEKTVDFTLEKFKYYYLEIKFTLECIAGPHQKL